MTKNNTIIQYVIQIMSYYLYVISSHLYINKMSNFFAELDNSSDTTTDNRLV